MIIFFPSRYLSKVSLGDLGFHIDRKNLRVRAEQLRTRMAMYPQLILSQVVLQFLFVWLFWEQAPHDLLLMWLACCYALHTAELVMWAFHRDELNTPHECRNWHVHFTVFALVAGLLWGAAAAGFYPSDIASQSLLICVMLGLVAGAVTMNPIHPPALYGYAFGVMLPLIVRVSLENDEIHWVWALMLIMFVAVVLATGRGLSKTFILSLQQRFENYSLLRQLTVQKSATEDARRKLELANNVLLDHESKLEQMVQERTAQLLHRTHEIELIKDTTIMALSSLAETRDNETGNHIRRTQNYIRVLAVTLKDHPRFCHFLTDENITLLYKIAPLHDVGKVGIPDRILHKPGKLTDEEFEIMKTHATLGGNAIASAVEGLDFSSPFLEVARQIAMSHHEKWDGSGYPEGLCGEDIPIAARLMALADVYDAMSCRRVYKSAIAHDEVASIIQEGRGKHFDPDVVDAFLNIQPQFMEIAEKYSDRGGNMINRKGDFIHQDSGSSSFSGIHVIYAHLEQRSRIEDYVNGNSNAVPSVPAACHADCPVGKWLHGAGGSKCTDMNLLDPLCKSCEEFREAAAQAVLLVNMGEIELAKAALRMGEMYSDASEEFQQSLARFHQQYSGLTDSR